VLVSVGQIVFHVKEIDVTEDFLQHYLFFRICQKIKKKAKCVKKKSKDEDSLFGNGKALDFLKDINYLCMLYYFYLKKRVLLQVKVANCAAWLALKFADEE
jgi:hypothetical protein